MKLLLEEMNKRWVLKNEFEINKEFLRSVWMFYSLYDIALSVMDENDSQVNIKNNLINKLVANPKDLNTYNKIKSFMANDVRVINKAFEKLEDMKGGGVQVGDYKKPTMVAININE